MLRCEVKVRLTAEDGSQEIKSFPLDSVNARVRQDENDLPDENSDGE